MHLFTFDKYEIMGWYGISFWNLQAPWDLLVQSIDLLSEAALTCTADISSVHLSGFLKEYHGHKLVKNHVLLRGSQSGHVWRLPWRFRTVDILGPILDFQRRKKETLKYFALTRMHTSELCDRRLAVYNCLLLSCQGLAEAYVQDLEQSTFAGARLSSLLVPAELLGSGLLLPHASTLAWSRVGIRLSQL